MTSRLSRITVDGSPRVVDLHHRVPVFPHLKVTEFGAVGDDATDNQAALVAAIAAAKSQGLPLCVTPGVFRHSGRLTVDGVRIFGVSARSSTLLGSTQEAHAIDLTGDGSELHNLTIRGTGKTPRTSDRGGNGVYVNNASGYVVRNCVIRDVTGAGLMAENASYGVVRNNLVTATGADGIYHTEGSHHIEIAYNRTVRTGDDALSVTSYVGAAGFCHDIDIHHNTVVDNWESRAITINGCNGGIVVRDNHIDGGTSGISVTSVTEWGTLQSAGVDVHGNTVRGINRERQDTGTIGGGAFSLWNDVGGTDSGIAFHDNQIHDPGLHGIFAGGSSPITATASNNTFYINPARTLYQSANPSATVTRTGNTTPGPDAYPGDLVPVGVGGLDPTYRYTP